MEIIDKIMKMVTGKTKEEREEIAKVKKEIQRKKRRGYLKGKLENAEEEGKAKADKELKDAKKISLEDSNKSTKDKSEFDFINGWSDEESIIGNNKNKKRKRGYFG